MPKKTLFLIIFIAVILIILIAISLQGNSPQNPKSSPTPTPNPFSNQPVNEINFIQPQSIKKVSPENDSILKPGAFQTFTVEFNNPINPNTIFIVLKAKNLSEASEYQAVDFKSETTQDFQSLLIKTKEPILEFHNYNLAIFQSDGTKLIQLTYISDRDQRAREANNNPELASYLPHKTDSYTLSYLPDRNLYVFSFSYNEKSPDSLDTQFEKAKADATTFIEEKGIDVSTLKIEWRYH